MLGPHCNGTLMYSSESKIVRNDAFLSKLEEKLKTLSDKYGLGDVLFIERNPTNNNSFNAFIIQAPDEWSNRRIFDVWDLVSDEVEKKVLNAWPKFVQSLFQTDTRYELWFMHSHLNI